MCKQSKDVAIIPSARVQYSATHAPFCTSGTSLTEFRPNLDLGEHLAKMIAKALMLMCVVHQYTRYVGEV